MKLYSRIVIDMTTLQVVEQDEVNYNGPIAMCCAGGGGGGDGAGAGAGPNADAAAEAAAAAAAPSVGETAAMGTPDMGVTAGLAAAMGVASPADATGVGTPDFGAPSSPQADVSAPPGINAPSTSAPAATGLNMTPTQKAVHDVLAVMPFTSTVIGIADALGKMGFQGNAEAAVGANAGPVGGGIVRGKPKKMKIAKPQSLIGGENTVKNLADVDQGVRALATLLTSAQTKRIATSPLGIIGRPSIRRKALLGNS